MIYLFIGEIFFRKKLLNTWKQSFKIKYNENNIIHVKNFLDYNYNFYTQNLLSNGFFSSKTLFIIDDFPIGDGEESIEISKFQDFILNILPKISDDTILVFNNLKADKKSKIYQYIKENGEIKDFSIKDELTLKQKLKEIYKDKISLQALNQIVQLKGLNFSSIINELEKLFITYDFIDIDALKNISKDIEENIFNIINDILDLNIKSSILKLRELNEFLDNFYLIYNSLISNLRVYFYIFLLKDLGYNNFQINEILELGNKSFLLTRNYKIQKKDFYKIYQNLIKIDGKMKTGKLIGNDKKDLIYELEKSLII